ncbi:GNAT family N-acetyltransferase [uncultured Friedmanniella sp.]|uniref:GNAT family N-acetyltransferase n=1 Tax=uncultured Friedmanniella sp. TaxID=335381 RepID=UPI0035CB2346
MAADPDPARDAPEAVGAVGRFPEDVPVLVDAAAGVILRALSRSDLPRVVEQCRDPEMIRRTTVPTPEGGYAMADAERFLAAVADGWRSGERLSWAVEDQTSPGTFCGSIALIDRGSGLGEVGFGLHPDARGRHLMSPAVRLVRDHAFDVLGLTALRWRAVVGNWGSRRVAAAAGFRYEGTVRRLLDHRGEWHDGWIATLTADDPRTAVPWLDVPRLTSARLRLRPFVETDAPRVAEACADPRTQHWLVSLPRTYGLPEALAYVEATREAAARGTGILWCVADATDDRCVGSLGLEGLGGYHRRAELGYWSHPDARGRGLTTEAVRMVTEWAEGAGVVDSLMIRAAADNLASRQVAEANGYHEAGVLRRSEPLADGTLVDLVSYARP